MRRDEISVVGIWRGWNIMRKWESVRDEVRSS